jgi:hypothetical protein
MKAIKTKIITFFALLFGAILFAQAPQKMSYQAIIRDASNNIVTNTNVGIRVSILQGSSTGTSVYQETHIATTNINGLVSLEVGAGAVVSGTFSSITWSSGNYYIKTETDPTGGTNYTISGTSQLLSVPYALYAGSSGSTSTTTNGVNYVGESYLGKNSGYGSTGTSEGTSSNLGNIAIGNLSMNANTEGYNNIALGFRTLNSNTSGGNNITLGFNGMKNNILGSENVAIGTWSLGNINNGNNVSIGAYSGYSNVNGTGNVFLGHYAGFNETGSDKLYISNSGTTNPLIYGEFNTGKVRISESIETKQIKLTQGATDGYVLQSDADGNCTWVNPSLLSNGNWTTSSTNQYSELIGNVGIGTTSPTNKLHVNSGTDVSNTIFAYNDNQTAGTSWNLNANYSALAGHGANQAYQAGVYGYINGSAFNTAGVLGAYSASEWGALAYNDASGNTYGLYSNANAYINGTTKTNGLQLTNGATNGYVLQSDASGNGSWVNPSTLGLGSWTTSGNNQYNALSGNVGLGVSSPLSILDITGTNTGSSSLLLRSGNTILGTSSSQIEFGYNGTSNYKHAIKTRHNSASDAYNAIDFYLWDHDTDASSSTGTKRALTITSQDNGKVGIANSYPTEALDVNGKTKTTNLQVTNGATNGFILQSDATGNGSWVDPSTLSSSSSWTTSGTNQYNALSGNVGIGTSSPTSSLHVSGSIATKFKSALVAGTTNPDTTGMTWRYTSGTGTITLPAANTCTDRIYVIINQTGTTRTISSYRDLVTNTQTTIGSSVALWLQSDGTEWWQIK